MNNKFFITIKNFYSNYTKTALIVVIAILYIIWRIYSSLTSTAGEVKYITTNAVMGTIESTISGSGQVSSLNQIDIKPKASGEVTYIGATGGQRVKAGALLLSINSSEARKAVRDAEINLESANISLKKLKIQNSPENLNTNLVKTYNDGFSAVSEAFIDLPEALTGIKSLLDSPKLADNSISDISTIALSYRQKSEDLFYKAQNLFTNNRVDFSNVNRNSPQKDIENIINETYNTTHEVSEVLKNLKNLIDFLVQDSSNPTEYSSLQSTVATYTNTINNRLAELSSAKLNINSFKDSSTNDVFDVQSSELSVKQKENALIDAKDKLNDYYVRAPFSGVVAKMSVKKYDSVSSGTSVATFIADQNLAQISLNELDFAKIKIGQKVNLTFDAVPDLTIAGTVAEVDTIGTVSQGVVNYTITISFDMNDERIKPGMSVSAIIVTEVANDVLYVPNSAIKSKGGSSYVEVFPESVTHTSDSGTPSNIKPIQKKVEIGISNDTYTVIKSGLNEGDQVISRTISASSTVAKTSAPSLLGGGGRNTPLGR